MGFAIAANETTYYPHYGIKRMKRPGRRWAELLDWVTRLPVSDPHTIALSRTIRHLMQSVGLNSSHKHDTLCAVCASNTLEAYSGNEDELIALFHHHVQEIKSTISTMRRRDLVIGEKAA